MDNKIFKALDFVLKKNKMNISDLKTINPYLLNRWISMCDPSITNILNITTNRWIKRKTNLDIIKFYNCVLPKYTKHIKYIKKKTNFKNTEEDLILNSTRIELSSREILEYNELIDFLSKNSN
jgi:hypothetical protein